MEDIDFNENNHRGGINQLLAKCNYFKMIMFNVIRLCLFKFFFRYLLY